MSLNSLEVNSDYSDTFADKDFQGNYSEKMPKKKSSKFVAEGE